MKIGFIGLGRMGKAIVRHLLEEGVDVVIYNRTREKMNEFLNEYNAEDKDGKKNRGKLQLADDFRSLIQQLETPRMIWVMVEHGKAVDEVIDNLIISDIKKGDIVIDGGNSFYKYSIRRYKKLKSLGVDFLDVGTSGGIEGARTGACLMAGGEREVFEKSLPLLEKIAVKNGIGYFGEAGGGHYVKMVHNGVEYGMLQALGEGMEILANSHYNFDLKAVAGNWKNGSVVRGWLVELLERVLEKDPKLSA